MFGPPAVDPKLIAELDKYRKNTDGARDKMNRSRRPCGRNRGQCRRRSSIDA